MNDDTKTADAVARIEARWAIEALIFRYAELHDAGDVEGTAALFADGAVSNSKGEEIAGAEALAERWRGNLIIHADGTPRTKHVTTNLVVDVDLDAGTATARSYVTVFQAVTDQVALQPIFAGGYADRFACVDGTWRFTHRRKLSHLVGDLTAHLRVVP